MNATSSGVAFSAAKMRSPSFSRSSSSTTTTALPAAMSATARSTESNLVILATLAGSGRNHRRPVQYEPRRSGDYCSPGSAGVAGRRVVRHTLDGVAGHLAHDVRIVGRGDRSAGGHITDDIRAAAHPDMASMGARADVGLRHRGYGDRR